MSLGSNSDNNISMNSVSSAELNLNDSELEDMLPFSRYNSADDEWKIGSDENFVVHDTTSSSRNKKIKLENESFTWLDDCINSNFNYKSIRSRLASQDKNKNHMRKNRGSSPDCIWNNSPKQR